MAKIDIEKEFEQVSNKEYSETKIITKKEDNEAFGMIVEYLIHQNIRRNEITTYFNQEGNTLTEQDLNYHFITLKKDNPKLKGITKQNFDITLNSTYLHSYNPIKEFFIKNKKSVGTGLIERLINSLDIVPNMELDKPFEGTGNTKEFVKTLFKKWIVGCIASIYPNNYNCLMFVLIGPKGCGKTEFFRRLIPEELNEYFAQSKFNEGKDAEALMCEKLIILNDELDGLNIKEAKTFRNFISANSYTYRPPYGKQNITRKRLASVCGTSNDRNIVRDAENNRRIIPVEINFVNHELYNSICKKELLLEAYQLYKSGYDWNLNKEDMKALDYLSEVYEAPSIEYELILKCLDNNEPTMEMTATEIKVFIEKLTFQKLSLQKIGSNLKRLGFECKTKKVNNKTSQVYSVREKVC